MSDPRRHLPSVDTLLASEALETLRARYPRARIVAAVRTALAEARRTGVEGEDPARVADPARWLQPVLGVLEAQDRPSLAPVVNATGVVIHTNLGRAPLARAALEAMDAAAAGYANLEFDLEAGGRGSRYTHCSGLLTELTGAEDALVVNNCAAGLMLALNTLAAGAGVLVSRGELVEIGGGFRIPEILERSGARLVEVGSTNRTRPDDYRDALEKRGGSEVRAVLKVHRSNFRITGFTEEAPVEALASMAAESGLPLLYDLGSGLLADPEALGLPPEPRAPEALAAGADVVVISGDKLLGGPQAGIVLGRAEHVAAMRRNPMCRALRVDKGTLAALEATLALYRDPETALREIPVLRMLASDPEELERRARAVAEGLSTAGVDDVEVVPGKGAVGGGTYPGVLLPSWTVRVRVEGGVDAAARALRTGTPAVVARIEDDRLVVDLRTVAPTEDQALLRRLGELLGAVS